MGHEVLTIAEGYLNPTEIYGIISDDINGSLPPTCPHSIRISPTEPDRSHRMSPPRGEIYGIISGENNGSPL